ncbi:MAG: toxin-antitoxin system YwqK family antitoxin [Myxococcota bacterium]|nr:toxin-antitoxin system YwqK family antitoxin [Myxococcota bacterium]
MIRKCQKFAIGLDISQQMTITKVSIQGLIAFCLLSNACEKKDTRCPAGSKLKITEEGKNKLESCLDEKGNLQGKQLLFFDNGTLGKDADYKDGQLDGTLTIWLKSGQMMSRSQFKAGKRNGLSETWSKDGQKLSETTFQNNEKHGDEILWFKNGEKASVGSYLEGRPHGKWTLWFEDGRIRNRTLYENGKVIGNASADIPKDIVKAAAALETSEMNKIGMSIQQRFQGSPLKSSIANFEMGVSGSGLYTRIGFFAASKPRSEIEKKVFGLKLAREIATVAPLVTSVELAVVKGRDPESRKQPIWTARVDYVTLTKLKTAADETLLELASEVKDGTAK